jgi:hypothetical protein
MWALYCSLLSVICGQRITSNELEASLQQSLNVAQVKELHSVEAQL